MADEATLFFCSYCAKDLDESACLQTICGNKRSRLVNMNSARCRLNKLLSLAAIIVLLSLRSVEMAVTRKLRFLQRITFAMIYFADFTRIMLMSKEILHCVNYALVGGE